MGHAGLNTLLEGFPTKDANEQLRRGCDILIATPGRLGAMVGEPNLAYFGRVKYTVIDEADELVNPDWEEDLRKVLNAPGGS